MARNEAWRLSLVGLDLRRLFPDPRAARPRRPQRSPPVSICRGGLGGLFSRTGVGLCARIPFGDFGPGWLYVFIIAVQLA